MINLFVPFFAPWWYIMKYLPNYQNIKLRCQYRRYWTLGRRPQASRRQYSLFSLNVKKLYASKYMQNEANAMGVGSFTSSWVQSWCKISQKWVRYESCTNSRLFCDKISCVQIWCKISQNWGRLPQGRIKFGFQTFLRQNILRTNLVQNLPKMRQTITG